MFKNNVLHIIYIYIFISYITYYMLKIIYDILKYADGRFYIKYSISIMKYKELNILYVIPCVILKYITLYYIQKNIYYMLKNIFKKIM